MVGYGENGSVVGPQNLPTSSAASGVWSLGEMAEAQRDSSWPNPTLGHWTFLGDPSKASGQPMSIYAEGGLYQTAAQAAAGNNEWLVIGRVTDIPGITGSAVGIINGLRINGNAPASGTISFNKGSWWSLSDGINLQERGSIIAEDASGNIYIQYAGYVGATYNPPKYYQRMIKLNSSLAEQVAYSYRNVQGYSDGLKQGCFEFINNDLIGMENAYEAQYGGTIKMAKTFNEFSQSTLQKTGNGYHIDGNGNSSSQSQLFTNHILTNTGNSSGQNAALAIQNYDNTYGSTRPQIQLAQLAWNGNSLSYNNTMDFTLYSTSTGGTDYYLADMAVESNAMYVAGYGSATSVVDSSSKSYSAFSMYQWSALASSVDFYVLKMQTGGKNENMTVYGLCLDYANDALYAHGYAANMGAASSTISGTWIAKINLDGSKKPSSLAWINGYCNEDFGVNAKMGRNSLQLTANNTITSFGYTQNQANNSYSPAVISLITVPTDGSAFGGSGTVGSCSVTSHDISSFVLFQGSGASTNVNLNANSGATNMGVRSGDLLYTANSQGTSNYTTLTPNPNEYITGGV